MDTIESVFATVADCAPTIRANLAGRRGQTAAENPTGQEQIAADVMADELLIEELQTIDGIGAVASEERESVIDCGDGLAITLDPLDGSSNLASNNPMGTIVGLYDSSLPARGTELVAAASLVFGPITTMTVARDGTVTEYEIIDGTLEVATEDLTLPADPVVYGFGGGDDSWTDAFQAFVRDIRHELKLRYGGAFVADINQILTYGGMFAYPALEDYPDGKLRLQYEGNPIAYIIEAAGGRSSDGSQSILERDPGDLHARTPVYVGNTDLIDRLESAIAGE